MEGETINTSRKEDNTKELRERALDGVTVMEYCSMISGPYCTKIMADLGAGVIKIESPVDGDPARKMPPFPGDKPHPEKSGLFFYLNSNKQGITLDPETPRGKQIFLDLVKTSDILVDDSPPGHLEKMGLGYKELSTINKGLILVSITPFGLTGPYRNYKGRALNISHFSGQAYLLPLLSPHSDRPPVKVGGNTSDCDPGLVAVVAVLAAFYRKGITGQGQHIDMSKQEALISMQRVESVTYANDRIVMTRTGNKTRMPGGVLPCKDGHVVIITPEEHQWNGLMSLIGDPEWSKEPWCGDPTTRSEHAESINKLLIEWTTRHTKEEIFRKGQALSCPVSPCRSAEDLINSKQLKTRGFFADVNHPVLGSLKVPTAASQLSESPWRFERPAPLLGESNEEVYCERLGYKKEELEILKSEGVI